MKQLIKIALIICFVVCFSFMFTACSRDDGEDTYNESINNEIESQVNDAVVSSSEIINTGYTYTDLSTFATSIREVFEKNNIETLKKMTSDDGLCIISLYGGMGVLESVMIKSPDNLQFKEGVLLTKNDPEVEPSEQEVGLSVDMFSDGETPYITNRIEGFIEHIDWSVADYDYLAAHFFAYYDQMVWTCINTTENDGWVLYQLCNNTYLFSNSYAWYSEVWQARVLVGQTFVIKRIDDEYKIVAFINSK